VGEADLSNAFTAWVVNAAGSRPIVTRVDAEQSAVDTFLEFAAPAVWLASTDPGAWKPKLLLRVTVQGRLLRASDGEPLRTLSLPHDGPQATFLGVGRR
jgi:hypothetical protein